MRTAFAAAALVVAVAGVAMAQTSSQMVAPNQTNPQAQANERRQPSNAHQVPSSGQANAIPTPTLSKPMTRDVQKPQIPSPAIR